MRTIHYIGLDTHCVDTEMAVVTSGGRLSKRWRGATTIPSLKEALESVRRPRYVTFEEGPLADWLFRNLLDCADELVVCEPRRNHLIAKDSDKDDPIDAEKLAQLYRGGYLKRVHHSESLDRAIFKQHVVGYHDAVGLRVARANRILAQFRQQGVFLKEADFAERNKREKLLGRLPGSEVLREDMTCLWLTYDTITDQEEVFRQGLVRQSQQIEVIRRFEKLPGIGWIRAATFYVYIDTPWRFHGKSALWKYMGIGLERKHSGSGPVRLQLCRQCNRPLKAMILGAALTAIAQGDNPFADHHQRWLNEGGLSARIARRNVARSLAATMWGMWKNGNEYRPEWVARGV